MGDFGLQFDFNYHLEQIEDVETVDWDVLEQIFGTDVDFAGSEVSIDANVSTFLIKVKQEMNEAFQTEKKTLLYQHLKILKCLQFRVKATGRKKAV